MDICVWNKCNNRCLMCTNPKKPWPARDGSFNYDYQSIIGRFDKYRYEINSSDTIYLSGGEPTLHPQFLEILKYLKVNFPKTRVLLLSNGRRFYYRDFTKKVIEINNNFEIDISLCGHNNIIHDAIARSNGSFKQSREGLKHLLKYKKNGQIVGVRHVINSLTYKNINKFLDFIYNDFPTIDRVILIFWEIEAMALENFKLLKVTYKQVFPYLKKIYFDKKINNIRFYHFPLCVLPENIWPNTWRTLPEDETTFILKCSSCLYKKHCLGIPKQYLKSIGDEEFKPIKNKYRVVLNKKNKHNPIKSLK